MARGETILELDENATKRILEQYVKPVMQKILMAHIESDIYGAYTPKEYAWIGGETYRRRESLLSPLAIVTEVDGNTLYMTSDAEPQTLWHGDVNGDGAFLAMLENGNMGAWSRVTGKQLPRPALSNAQKEVDKSQEIRNAVALGVQHYYKHN